MIKCENGIIEINGNTTDVMADFTILVRNIRKALLNTGRSEERVEQMINDAIRYSKMTEEEIRMEVVKKTLEVFGGK